MASPSEETIYNTAIQPASHVNQIKRKSTSSDGEADTSDERMDLAFIRNNKEVNKHGKWIEQLNDCKTLSTGQDSYRERSVVDQQPRPSTSSHRRERDDYNYGTQPRNDYGNSNHGQRDEFEDAERRADHLIREAELSKARMVDIPGKNGETSFERGNKIATNINGELMHSVIVDQNFLMVAAHIDESLKRKIINGEYVDFVKLLPRDRVIREMGILE